MKQSINTVIVASRRAFCPSLSLPIPLISAQSVDLKVRRSVATPAPHGTSLRLHIPLHFSNYRRNFSTFETPSTRHITNARDIKNKEPCSKNSSDSLSFKTSSDNDYIPSKELYTQTNGLPYTRMFPHDVETSMYLYKFGTPESRSVRNMREKSFKVSGSRGKNIMEPELCSYLTWQARQIRATRILELGTFTGSTTLALAQVVKEACLNCLDKPTPTAPATSSSLPLSPSTSSYITFDELPLLSVETPLVLTVDVSSHYQDLSNAAWFEAGVSKAPLYAVESAAADVMRSLIDNGHSGTFDLIVVDADKSQYGLYYSFALQLLRSGGLVTFDNVLWRGSVSRGYFDHINADMPSQNTVVSAEEQTRVQAVSRDIKNSSHCLDCYEKDQMRITGIEEAARAFPDDDALQFCLQVERAGGNQEQMREKNSISASFTPMERQYLREGRWMTRNLSNLRQFNARVAADPEVDMFILPMGDGLMLVTKK